LVAHPVKLLELVVFTWPVDMATTHAAIV